MHICYKALKRMFHCAKVMYLRCCKAFYSAKKNINHTLYHVNIKNRKSKVVVYCCITDFYDNLIKHTKINWDWDYICFTDNLELNERQYFGAWKILPIVHKEANPHLTNRYYKFKPHLVCSEYDYSIYVDGNIDIVSTTFFDTYSQCINNCEDLVLILHPDRMCVYEEGKACISQQKDSKINIDNVLLFLKGENFPPNFGLTANRVIFSNNKSNTVPLLFDEVFEFIRQVSKRDQLALVYVLWKHNFLPKYLERDFLSKCVSIAEHTEVNSCCDKRYGSDYEHIHNAILTSKDNPMLNFFRSFEKGRSVLEFGPSWGYYTRFLKEEKNCNVSICEYSRNAFLEAMQYASDGICCDIEDLEWVEYFKGQRYNYITFLDVLEHIKDPQEQIKHAEHFLSEDGLIIVSLPNIAYNGVLKMLINDHFTYQRFGILDNTHLRFFAYRDLPSLVSRTSLSIKSISFIYRNESDSYIDCTLIGWKKIFALLFMLRKLGKVFQFFLVIGKNSNGR